MQASPTLAIKFRVGKLQLARAHPRIQDAVREGGKKQRAPLPLLHLDIEASSSIPICANPNPKRSDSVSRGRPLSLYLSLSLSRARQPEAHTLEKDGANVQSAAAAAAAEERTEQQWTGIVSFSAPQQLRHAASIPATSPARTRSQPDKPIDYRPRQYSAPLATCPEHFRRRVFANETKV